MPLDAEAIGRGCTARLTQANQLCGLDLDRFKEALAEGAPITVACTQEEALFREVAESTSASPAHLRQHPRDRRLVEGCCRGGTKSRSADCRSGRRDAAALAGDARKQRRCADLWPRRDCHRGRAASRRSSGHHRASHQARRRRRRAGRTNFPFSRARSGTPADISGNSNLRSTITRCRRPPRAQNSCSGLRATAPPRPAI